MENDNNRFRFCLLAHLLQPHHCVLVKLTSCTCSWRIVKIIVRGGASDKSLPPNGQIQIYTAERIHPGTTIRL